MSNHELVPIDSKEGVTIYGRVIGPNGKLGQYEVQTNYSTIPSIIYHTYADAEKKQKELTGKKK